MSRIGKKPIIVPDSVTITITDSEIKTKGPKGEASLHLPRKITATLADKTLVVARQSEDRQTRALHGLIRSLLANAVEGVTVGYKKTLKIVGTGYKVAAKGANLSLALGFSHLVEVKPLPGVTLKADGQDTIHVEGVSKQLVGQMAANIRALKPPEPYRGKGIHFEGEVIRRKAGKAATGK